MLPLSLAALAAVCWGSGDFVGGLITKRLPILVVAVVSQAAGLVVTGILVLIVDPGAPSMRALAFGLLGGLFGAVGLAALYKGLAVGRMGIVAPIAAMSILVPVTVGFLQGDRPTRVQIVGMAVAVFGAILAATAPDPARKGRTASGLGYALVAAGFIGWLIVCLDAAGTESAAWSALTVRTSSVPLLAVTAAFVGTSFDGLHRRDVGILIGIGALDNLANVVFAFAASRGLLALVSVIGSLVPVVTVVLARFVLEERLTRHQLFGVVLALGGVAAIAIG